MKIIISGYGDSKTSLGLYDIDIKNKKAKLLDSLALNQPSFVTSCKDENERLFAFTFTRNPLAMVSYEIVDNKLELIDKINIPGTTLTHLYYDEELKRVYGCSYMNGSYMYINTTNGRFGNYKYIEKTKPALCHCIFKNKDTKEINVIDIKNDCIVIYDMELNYIRSFKLPDGVGPRHAIYNKKKIYVITEYSNEIYVLDSKSGEILEKISSLNSDVESFGATIFIEGDYLYVSNRGEDSIAKYKYKGKLEYCKSFSCFGNHPRHMVNYQNEIIISCNKDSNNVSIIDMKKENKIFDFNFNEPSGVTILDK